MPQPNLIVFSHYCQCEKNISHLFNLEKPSVAIYNQARCIGAYIFALIVVLQDPVKHISLQIHSAGCSLSANQADELHLSECAVMPKPNYTHSPYRIFQKVILCFIKYRGELNLLSFCEWDGGYLR